jgi:hypothetical protein
MIGSLLIYFVWKAFYYLADKHKKSKRGFVSVYITLDFSSEALS